MRWQAVTGTPNVLSGVAAIFTAPLVADPGTKFEYGINADWLGKVIEAASGVTLDVAIKDGITGPLGMDETTFLPSPEQRANATPIHVKGRTAPGRPARSTCDEEPEYWAGGHGLYSTPRDYIKFQRALLGGGELRAFGSCASPPSTPRSPTRSATSTSRRRSRPPTRQRPAHSRRPGLQVGLRAAAQHQ